MIPPRGFKAEVYPLRHRLRYSAGIGINLDTVNTVFLPIVMSSTDMDVDPETIQVNPHNTNYEEDGGPLVRQMSILDKMRISLKFNMTEGCNERAHTSGIAGSEVFAGDSVKTIHCLWRPMFGSFTEKLNATDDDTGATVASFLSLTVDATNEDVVPITTNKLNITGASDMTFPISTVNAVQVKEDYNMSTDLKMEDHVWDEDLFQAMLRRSTVKGALRSFVGRTRHFTLTQNRPYKNYYMDKFLPRSIRRVMPFTFFGIQIHAPFVGDVGSPYSGVPMVSTPHMGLKAIINYHEWNAEHDQDMTP